MRRTLRLFLAMVITLTLTLVFAPSDASAVQGGSTTFDCFLLVDENEAIPAMTFTYSITSGVADSTANPPVSAGIGTPTIGTAAFASGATTSATAPTGVTSVDGKEYAQETVTVDFSNVTFTEVGIYRYVITATPNTSGVSTDGITSYKINHDIQHGTGTANMRYMDVYVTNGDSDSELNIAYVLLNSVNDDTKSIGIVNSIFSHNFTFGKEVTGNQASKNQYFTFTLTLGSLGASEKYAVDLTNADTSKGNEWTNPVYVESNSTGNVTAEFHLKHNQYISVQGLPDNFTYTLSENADGYNSTATIGDDYPDPVTSGTDGDNTAIGVTKSIKTGFINSRTGIIPTGLLLTVTPFIVGLFLFGALFVYMMARKRKTY